MVKGSQVKPDARSLILRFIHCPTPIFTHDFCSFNIQRLGHTATQSSFACFIRHEL